MPREIKKKILDKASGSGAPPQEAKDQAEGMKGVSTSVTESMTGSSKSGASGFLGFPEPQGGRKLDSGFEFSLDDFDSPEPKASVSPPSLPKPTEIGELPETRSDSRQPAKAKAGTTHTTKVALVAAMSILPILVGFLAFNYWRGAADTPKQTIITKITRPIVVPNHQEKLEFLVLTSPPSERNLLIMNLELRFSDDDRHARFLEDAVLIRDLIFNFLTTKHPSRNTEKDWRKIIGAELADYLRNAAPRSRADAVQLARLSKL